jgi:hypothetical protein
LNNWKCANECDAYYHSKAQDLLGSETEVLEYLDVYGLDLVKATVLEIRGDFVEAIRLYLANGKPSRAIDLYLHVPENQKCAEQVSRYLMAAFWRVGALGTSLNWSQPAHKDLLSMASKVLKGPLFLAQPHEVWFMLLFGS